MPFSRDDCIDDAFKEFIRLLVLVVIVGYFSLFAIADADLKLMWRSWMGRQPESLFGKVVWITGASSGIGESLALRLAQAGCNLILSARRETELQRVKERCLAQEQCELSDENILVLPLDVTDYGSHEEKMKEVLKHFMQIDILVNNAGKSQRARWMDVELSVDRDMFEVNVLGPVSLTQAVLPHMIERGQGHIVVVSSLAGKMGAPMSRSYTGTKHALQGYFDTLRPEICHLNIDVTVVCPGPTFSNFLKEAATGKMGETVGESMNPSERRMTSERCAHLTAVAIANRQFEAWISQHPVLGLVYLNQKFPDLAKWVVIKMGLKRFMNMRNAAS